MGANQICCQLLPFFRRPGVFNADAVGVELDIVPTTMPVEGL